MQLTVLSDNRGFVFQQEPFWIQVTTPHTLRPRPALRLTFSQALDMGDTFSLVLNGESITFTVKSVRTFATDIPYHTTTTLFNEWVASVALALSAHYVVDAVCNIAINNNIIEITTKDSTATIYGAGDEKILFENTVVGDLMPQKVLVRLYESGRIVATLQGTMEESGSVQFDLSSLFHVEPFVPSPVLSSIVACNTIKVYTLQYAQIIQSAAMPLVDAGVKIRVMPGGRDDIETPFIETWNGVWRCGQENYTATVTTLIWGYFASLYGFLYVIRCDVTATNGRKSFFYPNGEINEFSPCNQYCVPLSPKVIFPSGVDNIASYRVCIVPLHEGDVAEPSGLGESTQPTAVSFSIVIEKEKWLCDDIVHTIMYMNELGGMDTIELKESDKKAEIEREVATNPLNQKTTTIESTMREVVTTQTMLTQDEKTRLAFAMRRKSYALVAQKWVEIVWDTKSIILSQIHEFALVQVSFYYATTYR